MPQTVFYTSKSDSIINNIELFEIPLENIALKTIRLARLLGDSEMQNALTYEVKGYPTHTSGLSADLYSLAKLAGRKFEDIE